MTASARRVAVGGVVLAATSLVAVLGYVLAGWDWLDAVYMVVITVFGVGYGEVRVMDPAMRLFTIAVILVGCSTLIYILGGIFQMITEGEIDRALGKRKMLKDINELEGHTIVCGFGRMGRVLAESLRRSDSACVVVERSPERQEEAEAHGFHTVEGDATRDEILLAAGIDRARALATVLPADALNVFITLTARHLNPALTIVARGEDPPTEQKLRHAGADHVVMPAKIGAERLAQIVTRPGVLEFFDKADLGAIGQELSSIGVEMDQFQVTPAVVGRTVGELESSGSGGFMVVAVRRAGGTIVRNPDKDFALAEEDRVLLLGHQENLPDLKRLFSVRLSPIVYRGAVLRR
jgi:voltage-gated potassium channel